jgi:hypothetical protein
MADRIILIDGFNFFLVPFHNLSLKGNSVKAWGTYEDIFATGTDLASFIKQNEKKSKKEKETKKAESVGLGDQSAVLQHFLFPFSFSSGNTCSNRKTRSGNSFKRSVHELLQIRNKVAFVFHPFLFPKPSGIQSS